MKVIVLLASLMFAGFSATAEVKPEGSIVPVSCGYNYLEGPQYPTEVCINRVTNFDSSQPVTLVVSLKFTAEKTVYYVIVGTNVKAPVAFQKAVEAEVKKVGNYRYYVGPISGASPFVFTQEGNSFVGPMFDVKLEEVFVTQSL